MRSIDSLRFNWVAFVGAPRQERVLRDMRESGIECKEKWSIGRCEPRAVALHLGQMGKSVLQPPTRIGNLAGIAG